MKQLIYGCLCALSFLSANNSKTFAQTRQAHYLEFKQLSDISAPLEWPATVTDGKYIYALCPYPERNRVMNNWRFDPENGSWSVIGETPYRLQASAVYLPDGNAYILGGGKKIAGNFRDVQTLSVKSGEMKELNAFNPKPTMYGGAAAWNNLIYVFGGTINGNQTIASLYSFDPRTSNFIQLADMPETVQTSGAIVNGILYTFGGYDSFLRTQSKNINAYDIKTNTWKTVATLPHGLSSNLVTVSGDLIFVISDYSDEKFLGYFDTRNNTFTQLNSNMRGHRGGGAAIVHNTLYVFGGKTAFNTTYGGIKTVDAADLTPLLSTVSASR
jgi:N-acetylneuraminic acid mutarotase